MAFDRELGEQDIQRYMRQFPDGLPEGGSVTLCSTSDIQNAGHKRIQGPKSKEEMEQWVRENYRDFVTLAG